MRPLLGYFYKLAGGVILTYVRVRQECNVHGRGLTGSETVQGSPKDVFKLFYRNLLIYCLFLDKYATVNRELIFCGLTRLRVRFPFTNIYFFFFSFFLAVDYGTYLYYYSFLYLTQSPFAETVLRLIFSEEFPFVDS
jgi:hypothetical protein